MSEEPQAQQAVSGKISLVHRASQASLSTVLYFSQLFCIGKISLVLINIVYNIFPVQNSWERRLCGEKNARHARRTPRII
jgi:hypothetical protein